MGLIGFIKSIPRMKNAKVSDRYKMIQETGNGFYAWNGRLYESDIIRSCIKPKTKAIGKAVAKHIRESMDMDGNKVLKVNPEPYMRFLLEEPNKLMTGQMLQEKVANQLALNNNAFILIVRDENGYPIELYPVPAASVEAIYYNGELFLRFYYANGKSGVFPYTDIIHIRDDYFGNDIFGEPPGKALEELMQCITTIDQGIVKAIKNSGIIRWLLKFTQSLRPEDLKKNVKEFTENYLSVETDTFGAAGVDAKADIQRVEPKDYVPNALMTKQITERAYSFFNTNEKIVNSTYTENEWISFYEQCVEPVVEQMAGEYTRKLFTRKERSFGNYITFESSNLTFASMSTKMSLVQFVDRAIMSRNEVRRYFNMAPVPGGDDLVLRKDTGILKEGGKPVEED